MFLIKFLKQVAVSIIGICAISIFVGFNLVQFWLFLFSLHFQLLIVCYENNIEIYKTLLIFCLGLMIFLFFGVESLNNSYLLNESRLSTMMKVFFTYIGCAFLYKIFYWNNK